jgi:hypothetical protein
VVPFLVVFLAVHPSTYRTAGLRWGTATSSSTSPGTTSLIGAALIFFGGWYLLSARKWFTGPARDTGSDTELADIARELRAR